jgi:hypothetical protein
MLQTLLSESGGSSATAIRHEEEVLDSDKTARVERWLSDLILTRKRGHRAAAASQPSTAAAKRERAESALNEDATI